MTKFKSDLDEQLATLVRTEMQEQGLNTYDMATRLGITKGHLKSLLAGRYSFTLRQINAVATVLDITLQIRVIPKEAGE